SARIGHGRNHATGVAGLSVGYIARKGGRVHLEAGPIGPWRFHGERGRPLSVVSARSPEVPARGGNSGGACLEPVAHGKLFCEQQRIGRAVLKGRTNLGNRRVCRRSRRRYVGIAWIGWARRDPGSPYGRVVVVRVDDARGVGLRGILRRRER